MRDVCRKMRCNELTFLFGVLEAPFTVYIMTTTCDGVAALGGVGI